MKKILFLIIFLVLLFSPAWSASAIGDFSYNRILYYNTTSGGANISASCTDFPIIVHINTYAWSESSERAKLFDTWNADGKRVQFFDYDQTTNLNYSVIYYSEVNQEAIYVVKVPTILVSSDGNYSARHKIYMAYGNDPNSSDQDNTTSVWDSYYEGVYHLGDNFWAGSSPQALDSTDNDNDGSTAGTSSASAQVGNGRTMSSSITMPLVLTSATNISFSFWLYTPASDGTYTLLQNGTAGTDGYLVEISNGSGGSGDILHVLAQGLAWNITSSAYHTPDSTWIHIGFTRGSTTNRLYVNGVQQSTGTTTANTPTGTNTTKISSGGASLISDELRMSSTERSASWLLLEYYSTKKSNFSGDSWVSWEAVEGEARDIRRKSIITLD